MQANLCWCACFTTRWRLPICSTGCLSFGLYRARLVTHKPMCLIVAIEPGLCGRIEIHADRSFVIGMDRRALQTPFPPSRIELRNCPKFRLRSFHSVLITSAARNPMHTIATTINGHSATTQKERFQSGLSGVGFLFIPPFSSVRRPTFHKT